VDFLQNGQGKLIAAPLSVRPLPGATVSTPLTWDEVGPDLDVKAFDLRTVPPQLASQGEDPLRPVLDLEPDLANALECLARML
jgi:bifunctional non-homologous end joining protein LigD